MRPQGGPLHPLLCNRHHGPADAEAAAESKTAPVAGRRFHVVRNGGRDQAAAGIAALA